jgi:hypothetical protein
MELYYELSKEVSRDIGLDLSSMEVLRMTSELKKLEEIYKPEFTKPHILHKTPGGTFIWIDTSYVKT